MGDKTNPQSLRKVVKLVGRNMHYAVAVKWHTKPLNNLLKTRRMKILLSSSMYSSEREEVHSTETVQKLRDMTAVHLVLNGHYWNLWGRGDSTLVW